MKKIAVLVTILSALSVNAGAFDVEAKYKQSCSVCHAMGVAGAPKAFDKAVWDTRMAKGMDKLVASVTNGKGAMPPKGLCNDCTADQYKQLIEYMATSK